MSFTSAAKFCVYDSWDLTLSKVSPRSRLYHLRPIGVGTSRTESFTSYIARLAENHCTSAGFLFTHEIAPALNNLNVMPTKSRRVFFTALRPPTTPALTGFGSMAQSWVEVVEELTLQRGLRFLTMLRWQNVLTERSLSRSVRSWCPQCFEEQRTFNCVIYEHLLWTLSTVEVCPFHIGRLKTVCPHCDRQMSPLSFKSRPGYCARCAGWLGDSVFQKERNLSVLGTEQVKYQWWIANQMGGLVASAPSLPSDPPKERVAEFISTCISGNSAENAPGFSRLVGVKTATVYSWLTKRSAPQNDLLLKVCYRLGVSFTDLLTKDKVVPNLDLVKDLRLRTQCTSKPLRRRNDEVTRELLIALEQEPTPSVREVAERLGYKWVACLHRANPDLCKLLTAKCKASPHYKNRPRPTGRKRHDIAAVKRTLQHALEEAVPQPLQETAKRLGYSSPEPFRKKLPKLCAAILERRAECWRERKENLRIALETILLEDPPPTLEEVHKRVGYKGHTGLSRLYKDLCHSIARRHAEYRKAQFKNICLKLEGALREQPPVSLGAAAGRLGHAPFYLRKKFPEVCQAIIERYAQFKSKRSLEKKNAAKTKIRLIARELHARGQYPSKARVKKLSERVVRLGTTDFNAIMRDVRRELALLQNGQARFHKL